MAVGDRRLVRRVLSLAKSSPWMMIAIGLHVIVAAWMSLAVIRNGRQKGAANDTQIAVAVARPSAEHVLVPETPLIRNRIPERAREELVAFEDVTTFVPTEDEPVADWHDEAGDPTGSGESDGSSIGGTSIGVGDGGWRGSGQPSGLLGKRPGSGDGRGPPGRRTSVPQRGTEAAVLEGLRWLMRHQNDDGSWSARTLTEHCSARTPCIPPGAELDATFDTGMTALALLAFLGQGVSVGSRVEIVDTALGRPPRRAGEVVKKGIRWLLDHQQPDGSFSTVAFELPENDTLPTMALCEAYALSPHNRLLKAPAQRALDFLVAAQKRNAAGARWGWGVGSLADLEDRRARGALTEEEFAAESARFDLSITCWVVMALKSAQTSGFSVPDEVLAGALAYGVAATDPKTSDANEPPQGDPDARVPETGAPGGERAFHAGRRAALGMLIRTFAGGAIDDPYMAHAAGVIAADVPAAKKDRGSVDFYYWYFATLALNQYDGPDSPRAGAGEFWEPWEAGLVASLLPLQERGRKRDVCARGGWLQEARGNRRGRALYNTALNALTLEVYYRFENVFGAAARDR